MYRSSVTVDLSILASNIQSLQDVLDPTTRLIFVVKSNAYGHGLEQVVAKAWEKGVRWFGVAHLYEAERIRAVLADAKVMIMGAISPQDVPRCIQESFTPIVVDALHAQALSSAVTQGQLLVHFKVDTGMARLGFNGWENDGTIEQAAVLPGLHVEGICSHFATVEPQRLELAETQVTDFMRVAERVEKKLGRRLVRHISSTRAILNYKDWDFDAIRPGMMLYGYGSQVDGVRCKTKPFLEWKSHLMQVKKVPANFAVGYYSSYHTKQATELGTICTGYADGFLRSMSNIGYTLAGGKRCAVIGRISMNWVTIDLGPDSGLQAGDEVVLIGTQGDDAIWANEVAKWSGTIPYEILTAIRSEVPRTYIA